MNKELIQFIQELYPKLKSIPLHAPVLGEREKELVENCIDSTFVSSVGEFVNRFEKSLCDFTGAKFAVATVNGTAALHIALVLAGAKQDTEVITQALTFVATANAIAYCGATPVFLDSDPRHLGLSTQSLKEFLETQAEIKNDGHCYNKKSGRRIVACLPMHVFGHPVDAAGIAALCSKYSIAFVEDAAESLGSYSHGKHTGLVGETGVLSFNGNKIVTTGGGGALITNDEALARRAKNLTTTAKRPHAWEFYHEEIGYNYRLPNLNAALGCAQMERLPNFIKNKRETADLYSQFCQKNGLQFISEPENCRSNYWLNAVLFENLKERNRFLEESNAAGVMTRPAWTLLSNLPMFSNCQTDGLKVAKDFEGRLVNLPSSVRP